MTCLKGFIAERIAPRRYTGVPVASPSPVASDGTNCGDLEGELRSALAWLSPETYSDWIATGQRLKLLGEIGLRIWLDWSARSSKFNNGERDPLKVWATFSGDRTGFAAIFAEAQRYGWINPRSHYAADIAILPSVLQFSRAFAANLTSPPDKVDGRYRLLNSAAIAALPPVIWRVRGVFPAQGLVAIYGPSGSGKSFLASSLAESIARGRGAWFGHKVTFAPIIYLALEGEGGFKARIAAQELQSGSPLPDAFRVVLQPFRLNDPCDIRDISDASRPLGEKPVIFIDTLNRTAPEADENSSKDMGGILEGAKQLQMATGGLVVLIAHTGKDPTKGVRGHSSLFAALDGAIEVTRDGERRRWSIAKSKDGVDGGSHPFRLKVFTVDHDNGEPVTSCVVERDNEPQAISLKLPSGANQIVALNALKPLWEAAKGQSGLVGDESRTIDLGAAVMAVAQCLTCKPVARRERARQAINGLITRGVLGSSEGQIWLP